MSLGGAPHSPLSPPRPRVLLESVWDAGAVGDPGSPVAAAAPRKGWNKRAFVAGVIISSELMGLEVAGDPCGG